MRTSLSLSLNLVYILVIFHTLHKKVVGANNEACLDNPKYEYRYVRGKTCDWIGQYPKRRQLYCKEFEVGEYCPLTCGLCCDGSSDCQTRINSSPSDNAPLVCMNNLSYRYNSKQQKTCGWIRQEAQRNDHCKHWEVHRYCPQSCGICCKDEPRYRFYTSNQNNLACTWLTQKNGNEAWCNKFLNGRMVRDACPESCGMCKALIPYMDERPTYEPTQIPTSTPTAEPSSIPTTSPTAEPSSLPSTLPTGSAKPSVSHIPSAMATAEPSSAPTAEPSNIPSNLPTKTNYKKCNVIARLGHPYTDPDDAPYYGLSEYWLEIQRGDDEYDYCDSETSQWWCNYENSDPEGESAYLSNVDDTYDDWAEYDDLDKEKFNVKNINRVSTMWFTVYRHFYEEDYYPEEETWNDHMMTAELTIVNKATNEILVDKLTHPVDKSVRTHIAGSNGNLTVVNPEYQGNFYIGVSCDSECVCESHDYTVFNV